MVDYVHLTRVSENAKTGPMPVSTATADWCPDACPFKAGSCYAKQGPVLWFWKKVSSGERGVPWKEFLEQVRGLPKDILWRYGQAGDLPGDGTFLDRKRVLELAQANGGRRAIVFTHYPMTFPENVETVRQAASLGLSINLSANNLQHADELANLQVAPVVVVLPIAQVTRTQTPAGRKVVVCPAIAREGLTCTVCQICARPSRHSIIGFPAHGSAKRKAEMAAGYV